MYLRINEDKTFGFVVEGLHDIVSTDIKISQKDYDLFFAKQEEGILYRLKENFAFNEEYSLFDYLEESGFTSEPHEPTEEEKNLESLKQENEDLKERLRLIEEKLGL